MSELRTLVISPNWIGDAVMAQPLLQRLKALHPERAIDVLAPPAVSPVWHAVAEVDTVLETPFRHGALQLKERWKYARMLRARGYAAAYVLPNTIKYALIPALAGIAERVGYKGESRYGLINRMHHDDQPKRPMVPFYAALAASPEAQLAPDTPRPKLVVPSQNAHTVCELVGIDPARPLVVFAPGAEFGAAKRWPARHFAALAQAIHQYHPEAAIGLLGSPKDKDACDEIIAITGSHGMVNLAGVTKLGDAIALISVASAVVANDSGLLHIASSLNRPVIALYGPTDPDHAPPFSDLARSMTLRLACSPCRQRTCPLGHHDCMEKLDAGQAWQALQPMLRGQVLT